MLLPLIRITIQHDKHNFSCGSRYKYAGLTISNAYTVVGCLSRRGEGRLIIVHIKRIQKPEKNPKTFYWGTRGLHSFYGRPLADLSHSYVFYIVSLWMYLPVPNLQPHADQPRSFLLPFTGMFVVLCSLLRVYLHRAPDLPNATSAPTLPWRLPPILLYYAEIQSQFITRHSREMCAHNTPEPVVQYDTDSM